MQKEKEIVKAQDVSTKRTALEERMAKVKARIEESRKFDDIIKSRPKNIYSSLATKQINTALGDAYYVKVQEAVKDMETDEIMAVFNVAFSLNWENPDVQFVDCMEKMLEFDKTPAGRRQIDRFVQGKNAIDKARKEIIAMEGFKYINWKIWNRALWPRVEANVKELFMQDVPLNPAFLHSKSWPKCISLEDQSFVQDFRIACICNLLSMPAKQIKLIRPDSKRITTTSDLTNEQIVFGAQVWNFLGAATHSFKDSSNLVASDRRLINRLILYPLLAIAGFVDEKKIIIPSDARSKAFDIQKITKDWVRNFVKDYNSNLKNPEGLRACRKKYAAEFLVPLTHAIGCKRSFLVTKNSISASGNPVLFYEVELSIDDLENEMSGSDDAEEGLATNEGELEEPGDSQVITADSTLME